MNSRISCLTRNRARPLSSTKTPRCPPWTSRKRTWFRDQSSILWEAWPSSTRSRLWVKRFGWIIIRRWAPCASSQFLFKNIIRCSWKHRLTWRLRILSFSLISWVSPTSFPSSAKVTTAHFCLAKAVMPSRKSRSKPLFNPRRCWTSTRSCTSWHLWAKTSLNLEVNTKRNRHRRKQVHSYIRMTSSIFTKQTSRVAPR